jgi:hypothetical protein
MRHPRFVSQSSPIGDPYYPALVEDSAWTALVYLPTCLDLFTSEGEKPRSGCIHLSANLLCILRYTDCKQSLEQTCSGLNKRQAYPCLVRTNKQRNMTPTSTSSPPKLRTLRYARVLAVIALIAVLIPWLTQPGIVGCPAWSVLHALPRFARGLVEMVAFVPGCNGLLSYIFPIGAAVILYRRATPALLSLLGCALAEVAYRAVFLGDTQWALLMPAWKLTASLILSAPILIIHFSLKK